MDELVEEIKRIMTIWEHSYINNKLELILDEYNNIYIDLNLINNKKDLMVNMLECKSRQCSIDKNFLNKFNSLINKNFTNKDYELIYQKLGNGSDRKLTNKFYDSDYDIKLLNKNKIIKVCKNCHINQEDFAPCMKELRTTAVNITSVKSEIEYGFINFMLAISDEQICCENYGTNLIWVKEQKDKYYIDHIILEENSNLRLVDNDNNSLPKSDCIVCSVYGENNELICYGYVFNIHNGYYAHNVYVNENFNTQVLYL